MVTPQFKLFAADAASEYIQFARLQGMSEWWHWMVLVAVCAAVLSYVIVMYRRDGIELSRGLSWGLVALRVLAFVGVLFFFLDMETGAKFLDETYEDEIEIEPTEPDDVQDPTGCGDAFRSGLIYGLLNDLDLVTCCRIGSVMGAIKVAVQGPQNHAPTRDEIEQRFFETYGYRF